MRVTEKCSICNQDMEPGLDCNPYPLKERDENGDGGCCRECDLRFVLPVRMLEAMMRKPMGAGVYELLAQIAQLGSGFIKIMRDAPPPASTEK